MTTLTRLTAPPLLPEPATSAARHSRRTRWFELATLLAPVAGAGLGGWLAITGDAEGRRLGRALSVGSVGLGLVRWQWGRLFAEQARYLVESRTGNFEVRHYASRVHAETVIEAAPWAQSLNDGFDRLAAYIFGKNDRHSKIAMTSPVTATLGPRDRAIRSVAFKMPDRFALEALPKPDDRRITLRRIPAHRVAALKYSGRYGRELPAQKRQELLAHVRACGLIPIGDVTFAGYDAPSTLPFIRRNEILVEVSSVPHHLGAAT